MLVSSESSSDWSSGDAAGSRDKLPSPPPLALIEPKGNENPGRRAYCGGTFFIVSGEAELEFPVRLVSSDGMIQRQKGSSTLTPAIVCKFSKMGVNVAGIKPGMETKMPREAFW